MTKHRWRESMKSICSSHIDPETDAELKGTKIEIEDKVQKILKLIKDENRDENPEENSNKEPLVELIEDFHKHYQSLYDRYDHLTGELRQKVHGKRKDSSSSSSSDSDDSPRVKSSKNGKVANEYPKVADGIKQELENANLEIADLKSKLNVLIEEKKALNLEYQAASLKVQEAEEIIKKLTVEAARLKDENSVILVVNRDLNVKLQSASEIEAELNQKLEDVNNKMSTLILENEAAVNAIEEGNKIKDDLRATAAQLKDEKEVPQLELNAIKRELSTTKDTLESAEEEVGNLSQAQKAAKEEKNSLSSKVLELSEEIKQGHEKIQELITESSQLMEKFNDRERELFTYEEMHEAHKSEATARMRDLEIELDALQSLKNEMEKQKDDELSALLMKLEDGEKDLLSQIERLKADVNNLELKVESLHTQKGELEEQVVQKSNEALAQVQDLMDQVNEKQHELESLQIQKIESEMQLEKRSLEISEYLIQIESLKEKIQELVTESSQLRQKLDDREMDFFTHKEMHESHKAEATAQITGLELELDALQSLKNEMEKQKDDELSALLVKLEDREKDLLSQIERLTADVNNLELKVESLHTQKGELEEQVVQKSNEALAQVQDLMDQLNEKQSELESLQGQKIESEMQLEKRSLEISEYLIPLESLKEKIHELITKSSQLMEKFDDREKELLTYKEMHEAHKSEATARMRDLELELNSLHLRKSEMEKQKDDELSALLLKLENKEKDVSSQLERLSAERFILLDDIKQAHDKIQEQVTESNQLREKLDDRERDFLTHKEMHESHKSEATARITGLELELDSLHSQKNEMEKQKDDELSALLKKIEDREKDLLSQVERLTADVNNLQLKVESLHTQKGELEEQVVQKSNEALAQVQDLMGHVNEKQHELESLQSQKIVSEMQLEKRSVEISEYLIQIESLKEELSNKAADQLKLLEEKEGYVILVKDLEMELDSLRNLKGVLEEQLRSKSNVSVQLQEEKDRLQNRIFELEQTLIEKESELCSVSMKFEAGEKEASSQILAVTLQVANLQEKINSLSAQKTELELQLERKIGEISKHLITIENLKEDLASKSVDEQRLLEEKESLVAQLKDMELEVGSLHTQKRELEELIDDNNHESDQLRKEKEVLQDRISDLEKTSIEREDQLFALQKKLEEATNEASAQIGALTVQINNLQQEQESLHAEKRELELLTEKGKQESAESLTEVENQNTKLASKIAEQEKVLKEQENAFNKLSEAHKQLEGCFEECKENLQAAERKMEEMTEEFHRSIESKDRKFDEMEETVEDLKRELEIKGDEVTTLVENVRNIEVKLRLSNQKLRITEQLLSEKEDDHTFKEEKYQQDNKLLHERIITLCEEITTYKEAQFRIKEEIAEKVNETFTGLDTLTMKFEEDYGHIETCVYEILNELQDAKSWAKDKNSEEEKLKKEVSNLVDKLKHERERESLLTEKVGELIIKLQKNEDEKENLVKAVKQLEVKMEELKKVTNEKDEKLGELGKRLNEKDAGILVLGEEKKEAIRQLCIWTDYHRERCDYLRGILSERTGGRRQISA